MSLSRRVFVGFILAASAVCSVWGLMPRWDLERADKSVAIIADFREVLPLARGAGLTPEEALSMLKDKGLRGLMVSELTGDDAAQDNPYCSMVLESGGTRFSILPGAPRRDLLVQWLTTRIGGDFLPVPPDMLKTVGVLPDIEGLEMARSLGLDIFYRPAPSLGWLAQNAVEALRQVAGEYPLSLFSPSGEIIPGYPDMSLMASVSREEKIPVAMVEFTRQLGASALHHLAAPLLLPLHSVTNEELMARNITRAALRDRLIRAAVERSIRLLVLRAAPQNMAAFTLQDYAEEMGALAEGLKGHGFALGWPKPLFAERTWSFSWASAWALAVVLLLMLWCYARRMMDDCDGKVNIPFIALFAVSSLLLAFLMIKFPTAARLAGALAAPLIVTEAALAAMDLKHNVWRGLGAAVLTALVGGLALAAFFSIPAYMLRLQTFSGVKLTLLLPPLLVLLHDLRRRVHPESLSELLSRPPLWGELALCGVLLAGLGLMVFRSGNVAFIPGFEARVREALERWLVARPRSREVFLGYPCLLALAFLVKRGLWARYREVLRIGVVLGFSSVVNSFCHFHTAMSLILLREFNGLWTGLLLGLFLVGALRWVLLPALRAARPLVE